MGKWFLGLLVLLIALPALAVPRVSGNNGEASTYNPSFEVSISFAASDTTDSEAIYVRNTCSIRAVVAGSDVLQVWAISSPTTAASSGTLLSTISSTTTAPITFQSGTYYVKVKASTATTGGSTMKLNCANTPFATTSLTPEICASESIQGVGYDPVTRRWRETCADFNWPGWRDSTQATASFKVSCTAEGAPHESCLRNGDTVYKGYWMRLALAAQYTRDGGEVITTAHPYELDGCGLLQDGVTRAKCPVPFDPEWEAESEFSLLGYPTYLMGPVVNRGVRVVGAGTPYVKLSDPVDTSVTSDTPMLVGTFIRDNEGPTSGSGGATPINDGPNLNKTAPRYRTIVGGNDANTYCHTTSATNPACNREASNIQAFKMPGTNEYGYESPIYSTFESNPTLSYVCVDDGVAGSDPGSGTGMCRGNRMVRCWNGGAASGRNVGGCIFDTDSDGDFSAGDAGNLNLGVCESFHDSMQYDRETARKDIQLVLALPNCSDDAASSAACQTITYTTPNPDEDIIMGFSSHMFDVATPIGSWVSPDGQTGAACGANRAFITVGYKGGTGGTYGYGAERPKYFTSSNVAFIARAARRDKMDLKGAGYTNIGFMPSSWSGRNSANLGDCPYQASASADLPACDNDVQVAFSGGYNGVIENSFFFRASHSANQSGIVETHAFAGGANTFRRNVIQDALRINGLSDWGEGFFEENYVNGVNVGGTGYPLFTCYSDNCVIRNNIIERAKVSFGIALTFGTTNNIISGNRFRDISHSFGGPFIDVKDSLYTLIENNEFNGVWGNVTPFMRVTPGYGLFHKPTVVFRGNRGIVRASGAITSGPTALILVESGRTDFDTTRADAFRSIRITDNDFTSLDATAPCFLWLEDDLAADAAAQVQEGWGNILLSGNNFVGPGAADLVCKGAYRTSGLLNNASNDISLEAENAVPRIFANTVNTVPYYDVTNSFRAAATVPDADALPEGAKVKIYDGLGASCAHVGGVLTGGGAIRTSCTAHPNVGGVNDGTWTAD